MLSLSLSATCALRTSSMLPSIRSCEQCGISFTSLSPTQRFCGLSCRRRAERRRAAARDPQRSASLNDPTTAYRAGWYTTLLNPTLAQLTALRAIYDGSFLLRSELPPSLLEGVVPSLEVPISWYVAKDSAGNLIFSHPGMDTTAECPLPTSIDAGASGDGDGRDILQRFNQTK